MNYISFECIFGLRYVYVDLNVDEAFVADSLFYRRKIPVRFGDHFSRDGEKYQLVSCKIRRKHRKAFEEALEELKTKMLLLGHNDYEAHCDRIIGELLEATRREE